MTETDTTPQSDTEQPTVLIVEDEVGLADLYAAWLDESAAVRTAYDGKDALQQLDESVDVVFLDRRMPGMSGDEVLEVIREEGLDCRVVIVSAVTPDFDVIGMGFDDYLIKPVEKAELRDSLEQMLARAEYDDAILKFLQLVGTKATIDAQRSDAELRGDAEYAALTERIENTRAGADAALEELSKDDLEVLFRDLESDVTDRHSSNASESGNNA